MDPCLGLAYISSRTTDAYIGESLVEWGEALEFSICVTLCLVLFGLVWFGLACLVGFGLIWIICDAHMVGSLKWVAAVIVQFEVERDNAMKWRQCNGRRSEATKSCAHQRGSFDDIQMDSKNHVWRTDFLKKICRFRTLPTATIFIIPLVIGRGKIFGQFEPQTPLTWPVCRNPHHKGNLACVFEILDSPGEFLSASQFHCNWTISLGSNWSLLIGVQTFLHAFCLEKSQTISKPSHPRYCSHHCVEAIMPEARIWWVATSTFQPPPIWLLWVACLLTYMCQTHVSSPVKVAKERLVNSDLLIFRLCWATPICTMATNYSGLFGFLKCRDQCNAGRTCQPNVFTAN